MSPDRLDVIEQVLTCTNCELVEQCTSPVPMRGQPSRIVVVGEAPGETEDQVGKPFCLDPNHRVLLADLSWKPLGDVQVGDELLAPDEVGPPAPGASSAGIRRWRVATVTSVHWSRASRTRVVSEFADLVGTPDHLVLTSSGTHSHSKRWLPLGRLMAHHGTAARSSALSYVFEPWKAETSWESGWLAGFFDGEGHVIQRRKSRVGFAQNEGPTRHRALEFGRKLGFDWTNYGERRTNGVVCGRHYVKGGVSGAMQFLGRVRPERLLSDFRRAVVDREPALTVHPSAVEHREAYGLGDVVDITTTTGTFIAEGVVVHNCGPAGRLLGRLFQEVGITEPMGVVNTVSCWPHEAPHWDHMVACEDNKWAQIDYLDPTYCLLLGQVALKGMRRALAIKTARARPFIVRDRICWATYHPAAALRNGQYETQLVADLVKFKDLLDAGEDRWREFVPDSCAACSVEAEWWEDGGLGWCRLHLPDSEVAAYNAAHDRAAAELTAARHRSEHQRDAAIAAVEANADDDWLAEAYDQLVLYLKTHPDFFVDDFWRSTQLRRPHESRALGPVVMKAARSGLMRKSGEFRKSVASNMTEKPVWESLIYQGP